VKIKVDPTKCTGIGLCEATSPHFFEVDDNGELHFVQGDDLPDDVRDQVDVAIQGCPTAALSREV
jgi:ferredoxin